MLLYKQKKQNHVSVYRSGNALSSADFAQLQVTGIATDSQT